MIEVTLSSTFVFMFLIASILYGCVALYKAYTSVFCIVDSRRKDFQAGGGIYYCKSNAREGVSIYQSTKRK